MIQRAFQHRSGRVIALSRALLAVFFALAVSFSPTHPERFAAITFLQLVAFSFASIGVLVLTWDNWWLESRLAGPTHVVDLIMFTILVALSSGYGSPFFAIFVFLVLSATIRWGWREALGTTLIVLVFFLVAGVVGSGNPDSPMDVQRLMLRATNLVVLSLMIIWFGVNHYGMLGNRSPLPLTDALEPPVRQALEHVAAALGAGRTVFAWSESEEPWLHVATLDDGRFEQLRFGPDVFPLLIAREFESRPFLYDTQSRRLLWRRAGRRNAMARRSVVEAQFAARFGVTSGIVVPMRTEPFHGHIFATGILGLCSDDLEVAAQLGADISLAFERVALLAANREAAENRARLVLARDLHDSVVQFQAGMALKLHGIKMAAEEGASVTRELDELRQQLAQEQRDLRSLISALRDRTAPAEGVDLCGRLETLCSRLERQWGVRCAITTEPDTIEVQPQLQHDIDQLIREAVANAARHGGAGAVHIGVTLVDGKLRLDVSDDGVGFPVSGEFDDQQLWERRLGPRSLQERIRGLGGRLRLTTSDQGSRLAIALPCLGSIA